MQKRNKRITSILAMVLCITMLSFTMGAFATVEPPAAPADGDMPGGTPPEGMGAPPSGGADTMTYDYSGELKAVLSVGAGQQLASRDASIGATDPGQNAALVQAGGILGLTNGTLHKTGDETNADNCNFYGINSIFLATGENTRGYISDSDLTAESEGSNGLFSTDNAILYAKSNAIHTSAANSRGLDATYGGTIIADDIDISTLGEHCGAIATDRGGGNISLANGTLSTSGSGSPLLYSTGNVQIDHVTGTASGSQIAGMEGLNSILIFNSDLTSTIEGKTASDPVANGVIIYQSTSGDAEAATGDTATFQLVKSQLTSNITSGAMFYVTNTRANILLSGSVLDFDSNKAKLLRIEGNDDNNWGTPGENGAQVKFTARDETLFGNITIDSISSLDMYLLDATTYTGAISVKENEAETEKTEEPVSISIDSSSKWVVTANSSISNLSIEEGAQIVDPAGKTVKVMKNGETIVSGDSTYTVTVTGEYNTSVTTDESNQISEGLIDRTEFDAYYQTNTAFGQNGEVELKELEPVIAADDSESSSDVPAKTSSKTQTYIDIALGAILLLLVIGFFLRRRHKKKADKKTETKTDDA